MAIMKMPFSCCRSEGEKIVYQAFKDNLSDEYTIWSNIELLTTEGRQVPDESEIDFLLYHRKLGLLLFSVKDWRIDHIKNIGPQSIYLTNGKRQANPYNNVKHHFYTLKNKLDQRRELWGQEYQRKICVPINVGLIFPYIEKQEWQDKLVLLGVSNPDDVRMPVSKIFFRGLFNEKTLLKAEKWISGKFDGLRTVRFNGSFDTAQLDYLDGVLGVPDTEETLVKSIKEQSSVNLINDIITLDKEQKRIADNYLQELYKEPGHLVIRGIAGSGKTIILQHMFTQIARDPSKKILYIGRQNELVEDFKENLKSADIYLDSTDYFVGTFHSYCRHVFGEKEYSGLVEKGSFHPEPKALSRYIEENIENVHEKYDFVFIDEGHNLPDPWIKLLVYSAKGKGQGSVVYVEDFEQNIYKIVRDPRESCLRPKKKEELLINYRNTKEISYFALNLTDKYALTLKESNRLADLRKGSIPTISLCKEAQEPTDIYKKFAEWIDKENKPRDITVIYPKISQGEDLKKNSLFYKLIKLFKEKGHIFSLHYPTTRIQKTFPEELHDSIVSRREQESEKAIKLVTSFSSQGISYKNTIVLMDGFKGKFWSERTLENMLYVSLTRATDDMMLIFSNKSDQYEKAESIIRSMKTQGQP